MSLDRAGVKLSYQEGGTGGVPMVLIHGWTCDHSYFAPQFDRFSRSRRVVAVDLRGHGSSDAPEGDYSMPTLADDVAWLCEQLGIQGAVLVGHSMGAAVSVEAAARHPHLVSTLVLVDAAPIVRGPELAPLLQQLVDGLSGPDALAVRRDFVGSMLFLPTDDPVLKNRVLTEMLAAPAHVAMSCFQGIVRWDSEAAIKAVKVPVLAIHADQPINDPEALAGMCPTLSNARTPGVGHFNQLLAAGEVNGLIDAFLA